MVTLLVSGSDSRSEMIEIIKENFATEVCNNMPDYDQIKLPISSTSFNARLVLQLQLKVFSLIFFHPK